MKVTGGWGVPSCLNRRVWVVTHLSPTTPWGRWRVATPDLCRPSQCRRSTSHRRGETPVTGVRDSTVSVSRPRTLPRQGWSGPDQSSTKRRGGGARPSSTTRRRRPRPFRVGSLWVPWTGTEGSLYFFCHSFNGWSHSSLYGSTFCPHPLGVSTPGVSFHCRLVGPPT